MALVKKQSNSRAIIILIVGLAVAGIGYFLFQRFAHPSTDNGNGALQNNGEVITKFGESILEDPRYKSLQSFDGGTNSAPAVTIDPVQDGHNPNPFE